MFNLKHKSSSFFKGDRELSLLYIPTVLIWMFLVLGEATRIFLRTPEHITLQFLRFLPPSPISLFLDTFVYAVLIGTVFYFAFRYLSKWLVFILIPLCGIVFELIWCHGSIAGFAAQNRIPQSMVIVFWVVIWLICWGIPYFIIKQRKNVPVMLIVGGIVVFTGVGQQLCALLLNRPDLAGFFTVILSPLLIISGVAYWYKQRKRKK